ncbi:MAG: beta-lactamase family protein [Steroidobacter sp.]|nr:beta-lactamase family protein [Steroidobacter sp.]
MMLSRRLAIGLCLIAPMATGSAADRFEPARAFIRQQLLEQSVPSVAVAVAKDGKIIWEEGFGWADRERRVPATPHTMYSLASISKPITATALMTLAQAGKVDLDKPANQYLGSAKLVARIGDAREATLRRIANHTSGLPTYHQFFYSDAPYPAPGMDETIAHYGSLLRVPGQKLEYSNIGFGVLGHVIERVSGVSYGDFMQRELFAPLGMTRSSVNIGPGLESYAAVRYGDDQRPLPPYVTDTPGAADVYSSAHDLVRFGLFHMKAHLSDQKAILSDASIDAMKQRTSFTKNARSGDYGFGVGFMVLEKGAYRVVGHGGGLDGVSTQLYMVPDEGIVIVALSNLSWKKPFEVPDRIAEVLLPKWSAKKPATPSTPQEKFATPSQLAGSWRGVLSTYRGDMPLQLQFQPSGEVRAKLGDQLLALVDSPEFQKERFTGQFVARIDTPDAERFAYVVDLELDLRGERLTGSAHTPYWLGGFKQTRRHGQLAHWVDLSREHLP